MVKAKCGQVVLVAALVGGLLTSCSTSSTDPHQISWDEPARGTLIMIEDSMYDSIKIRQDDDDNDVYIYTVTKDTVKSDEPHAYRVAASRRIQLEDIKITWYSDEYGKKPKKDKFNLNTLSARIVIKVDGVVIFDHLESFIENA
ncbi:hypothetical protein [Cutibacterium sp.]|uniref:hypothetical protein n=1 Tax=Cutibacterium sp. TaxID=1912221 RepID=UPI0026DC3396|nr:hypothetical protein [Cutibacterium sp.]MDO4411832.1 hypothetical protein [Cutibacterium sp.]